MNNLCNSESIMVTLKMDQKKSDFLGRNILTCDTQLLQKMPILVLKRK